MITIISSLGRISNLRLHNLSAILNSNCRSVTQLWVKRVLRAAFKGSFRLVLRGDNQLCLVMEQKKRI
jgi:hypothetical protein